MINKNISTAGSKIDENQRQVIIGSILGDCSLRRNRINCYFEEIHSIKQRDYLIWKSKYLKCFNTKTKIKTCKNRKLNKAYKEFLLRTSNSRILTDYYNLFYPNEKKIININLLNSVNKFGLTVWYLDDGHTTILENIANIATSGYSYNEHLKIRKWFNKRFRLNPTIRKSNKNYFISFNRKDSDRLLLILRENFRRYNVPKCMWYKLGRFYKGNLKKIEDERNKKNEYRRLWRSRRSDVKRKEKLIKAKKN